VRRPSLTIGVLACAAIAALLPACARQGDRPDILLVTIDTLRADHSSAYGYRRPTTPVLERLARDGVRCAVAYAPMATTAPSHASMFTGRLPRAHGVLKNGHVLPARASTLAEILREQGYDTGAVVSSFAVHGTFGLRQGFETYDDAFTVEGSTIRERAWEGHAVREGFDRRADETASRAIEWLRARGHLTRTRRERPFFLWVHFFDPHSPYVPPPGPAARFPPTGASQLEREIAAYDAEVHFADEELGRLVASLESAGRLDGTLVVVTSDHGEGLMQHGHMEHGLHIYEEAVRVPLVFRWPGHLPAGRAIDVPVPLVDLTPTILGLGGVSRARGGAQGENAAPLLRGDVAGDEGRPIFLQRRFYASGRDGGVPVSGEKVAVRAGRLKLISAPAEASHELYDLVDDPGERRNLYAERPGDVKLLTGLLGEWRRIPPAQVSTEHVSEEDLERLRALGYVR
jgi:arylsulfatase A-like enzyme